MAVCFRCMYICRYIYDNEYRRFQTSPSPSGIFTRQTQQVRKQYRFCTFYIQMIVLPRQARDKHRESTQKETDPTGTEEFLKEAFPKLEKYVEWDRQNGKPPATGAEKTTAFSLSVFDILKGQD